jgi:hypothetical protein
MILVVVPVLLGVGCGDKEEEFPPPPPPPPAGEWANVECLEGSGVTAWKRLKDIYEWAKAHPGDPEAQQAKEKALTCAKEHLVGLPEHRVKVLAAWNAARIPDWTACVSELTHGPDGSGTTGG